MSNEEIFTVRQTGKKFNSIRFAVHHLAEMLMDGLDPREIIEEIEAGNLDLSSEITSSKFDDTRSPTINAYVAFFCAGVVYCVQDGRDSPEEVV